MGKITFSGAVPAEGMNGLGIYADEFLKNPRELRLVIGLMSSAKTVTNHETGVEYPVLVFRHLEKVAGDEKSQKTAAKLLADALANRTGAVELPFEPGDDAPMKEAPFPEENSPDDREAHE